MAENIDSAKIAEFKECFNLYDRDSDGMISSDQVGIVMRSLGQSPTIREVNRIVNKLGKPKITFPEFLELMWQVMQKGRNPDQEIYEGFQMYDKGKSGAIPMKDLYHILTRTGEKLTTQEFEYMIKALGISKTATHVNYAELAKVFGHV